MLTITKFREECYEGNRNEFFARVALWFRDDNTISSQEGIDEIRRLNSLLSSPLSDKELDSIVKDKLGSFLSGA
jgi:hypothetical protein